MQLRIIALHVHATRTFNIRCPPRHLSALPWIGNLSPLPPEPKHPVACSVQTRRDYTRSGARSTIVDPLPNDNSELDENVTYSGSGPKFRLIRSMSPEQAARSNDSSTLKIGCPQNAKTSQLPHFFV